MRSGLASPVSIPGAFPQGTRGAVRTVLFRELLNHPNTSRALCKCWRINHLVKSTDKHIVFVLLLIICLLFYLVIVGFNCLSLVRHCSDLNLRMRWIEHEKAVLQCTQQHRSSSIGLLSPRITSEMVCGMCGGCFLLILKNISISCF